MIRALLTAMVALATLAAAASVERYFAGSKEISKADYEAIAPDMLQGTEIRESNDTTIYIALPHIHCRLDSSAQPGRILVVRKSEAEIAAIDSAINAYAARASLTGCGEPMPDFTFPLFSSHDSIHFAEHLRGKVVVLNFWATWCGSCLKEFQPQYLPAVLSRFKDCEDFRYVPISVNHSAEELDRFFAASMAGHIAELKTATAWDRDGAFAARMSAMGVPLTIVIDAGGIVRMNHAGAITEQSQLEELRLLLANLLAQARKKSYN